MVGVQNIRALVHELDEDGDGELGMEELVLFLQELVVRVHPW